MPYSSCHSVLGSCARDDRGAKDVDFALKACTKENMANSVGKYKCPWRGADKGRLRYFWLGKMQFSWWMKWLLNHEHMQKYKNGYSNWEMG